MTVAWILAASPDEQCPNIWSGCDGRMLSTTKRIDGTMQVTYFGWPLYYYNCDKDVGDTTGENMQCIWFMITPEGVQK
jgi:predicted lipoprotein with Yx(FWY)xxD motif